MAVSRSSKSAARRPAKRDGKSDSKRDDGKSSESATPSEGGRLKIPELLVELEEAAKQLEVRVTYEAMSGELGAGGLCKVKGQWRVIIDKRATPGDRLSILALALSRVPREGITLTPAVEKLLTEVKPRAMAADEEIDDMPLPVAAPPVASSDEAPATGS
jgi:hypothetical protein